MGKGTRRAAAAAPKVVELNALEEYAFQQLAREEADLANRLANAGRSVLQRAGVPETAPYQAVKDERGVIRSFQLVEKPAAAPAK